MEKDTKSDHILAAAVLTLASTIKEEARIKKAQQKGFLSVDEKLSIQSAAQNETREDFEDFLQKIS